ncbi:MAG TPA: tetratricopeptide repeat protein [Roseiflexaceae bacterium]|nr:tetratricopeptide repeat protein [Roseiflexaceae bacterium]
MDFTFAELLRSYRERASLPQAELAQALQIHRNTLSGWERGQYRPRDPEQVVRIATELSLTPSETDQLLRAAGLSGLQRAPSALPARRQLRPPVADFVGRAAELALLASVLRAAAQRGTCSVICGIQGMGGVGKTELALRVAQQVTPAFPDAQIVVALRGMSDAPLLPEQALLAVIRAFAPDIKPADDLAELQALYQSLLHSQRALILADDAADAAQVRPLIPPPGCALLITSRTRLILPGMTTIDLDQLCEADGLALLRSIAPRVSEAEARVLAQSCGLLPLALRVSGSILRTSPALPVAAYHAQLCNTRQRLAQLRDPDDPQLDVAASLTLSYTQLDQPAQQTFRQLGVLEADFVTEHAQAVAALPAGHDVERMLHVLLRRNLIVFDCEHGRWSLHDLVRDLAQRYLEESGEHTATTWRYAEATAQLALSIQNQYLAGGEAAAAALARFNTERPHLDAARRWASRHAGTPKGDRLLLAVATATASIGRLRYNARRERIPLWEAVCTAARRLGERQAEARALNQLGNAYLDLGEARRASGYFEEALAIHRALGERQSECEVLNNLGLACYVLGELRRAIPCFEESLALARLLNDQRREAMALNNLGITYHELGEAWHAVRYYEQGVAVMQARGNQLGEGQIMSNLGLAHAELGQGQLAIPSCEQAIATMRRLGDRQSEGSTLGDFARAMMALGAADQAVVLGMEALAILREVGAQREEGDALCTIGVAYAALGDQERAREAFAAAQAVFQTIGSRSGEARHQWEYGLFLLQQGERERALRHLRAALDYQQEIGHTLAAARAVLLARLEAGEPLPPELLRAVVQRSMAR